MIPEYTDGAVSALNIAKDTAKRFNGGYIGTEHVLMGLIMCSGTSHEIFINNGVDKEKIFELTQLFANTGIAQNNKEEYSPRAKAVLDTSLSEAVRLGQKKIGTEHVLLAILKDTDSTACKVIKNIGLNIQKLYVDCVKALGHDVAFARSDYLSEKNRLKESKKSATPFLERYGRNLNEYAKEGMIDPVIGRDRELLSVIQILSRRSKNNPCLIGEAGVGKTAVAEALAQKIVEGSVPEHLKKYKLYTLDLSGMVAGSKYRGEFEERIKKVINEAVACGDVLLFIDEIHSIIGAGSAEGTMDASNILKPYLARGEIQVIGATTTAEYRKHIEKDAALERRFQSVMIEEPNEVECVSILKGLRSRYEEHHKITISDEAIDAAVKLTMRYVNDRFLPDKAIDAMDEAASKLKINLLGDLSKITEYEIKISELQRKLESALKEQRYDAASHIRKDIDKVRNDIDSYKKKQEKKAKNSEKNILSYDEVASVVSDWTGIPVRSLGEDEIKRLRKLESILHKRVVGQNEAVNAVSAAVRRGRTGLKNPNRPVGSFLFLGPTGVGKTELSKALAEAVFGSENDIIRVDMSEYMEKHSVSKMVGSPPGYVGYEEGGQLSEKIRRKPYSVLLFDEIEKAHPDVFNILLQILEDGHITDSQGRKVSFKDTIIIMTSNAGANRIASPKLLGFATEADEEADYKKMKQGVLEEVKKIFKPEFINRIDEMIVFHSLTADNIKDIAKLMINELCVRAKKQLDIEIKVRKNVYTHIAESGFDKDYGARPLRRAIQNEIEDVLSAKILDGSVKKHSAIRISYSGGKMQFDECE